jgi:hypothetical protein
VYFSDAVRVLLRRWRIVLLGALLMAGAGAAALVLVPTNQQASGQVLLLPPSEPVLEGSRVNPYLNLPSGLTFTASLLAGAVSTPDAQREMKAAGFASGYSVSVVPGTGPLLVITVKDTDQRAALATRDELIRRIEDELAVIQAKEDVPDGQIIVARRFGVSAQAEVIAGARIRAVAVILALGVVLTAVATFSVDRMVMRRPAQRDQAGSIEQPEEQAGAESGRSGIEARRAAASVRVRGSRRQMESSRRER